MMSLRFRLSLIAMLAAVCLFAGAAKAKSKPFKITGYGVGPSGLPLPGQDPRLHWAIGEGTQLGRYDSEGTVETNTATDNGDGTITGEFGSGGPYTFTAANGDNLVTYYGRTDKGASQPGAFTLTIVDVLEDESLVVKAEFVAEFVPQPDLCTGKFAGVTGSWTMIACTEPFVLGSEEPVYYAWHGSGTLNYP